MLAFANFALNSTRFKFAHYKVCLLLLELSSALVALVERKGDTNKNVDYIYQPSNLILPIINSLLVTLTVIVRTACTQFPPIPD